MSENKKSTAGTEETDPAATMGLQMYRDLNMSSDAVIHLMPRVHDERIKTGMSAALCFYEKTAGKVRNILTDRGIEAKQENPMSKMAAHMGITRLVMLGSPFIFPSDKGKHRRCKGECKCGCRCYPHGGNYLQRLRRTVFHAYGKGC